MRVFGNMDDFTGFVADLFLTRQPLNTLWASDFLGSFVICREQLLYNAGQGVKLSVNGML